MCPRSRKSADNAPRVLAVTNRACLSLAGFTARFPPWRHCFHWMAGMLASAGLHDCYEKLRKGINALGMK